MPEFDDNDEEVLHPAVEEAAAGRRIQNPDDVVGVCTECKGITEPQMMERNIFAQEGQNPPCRFCGGVVVVAYREIIDERFKNSLDAGRGIGSG